MLPNYCWRSVKLLWQHEARTIVTPTHPVSCLAVRVRAAELLTLPTRARHAPTRPGPDLTLPDLAHHVRTPRAPTRAARILPAVAVAVAVVVVVVVVVAAAAAASVRLSTNVTADAAHDLLRIHRILLGRGRVRVRDRDRDPGPDPGHGHFRARSLQEALIRVLVRALLCRDDARHVLAHGLQIRESDPAADHHLCRPTLALRRMTRYRALLHLELAMLIVGLIVIPDPLRLPDDRLFYIV